MPMCDVTAPDSDLAAVYRLVAQMAPMIAAG
jgi:hypothetical protein